MAYSAFEKPDGQFRLHNSTLPQKNNDNNNNNSSKDYGQFIRAFDVSINYPLNLKF